jgi:PAS domain-containing protein
VSHGHVARGVQHSGEDIYWKKDGASFPIEFTSGPLIENNLIRGAVVTFRDISERKEAEEELRRVSRQAELILATAGEGILGPDREGTITFVNNAGAAMLGQTVDEMTGKNQFAELVAAGR